MVSNTTDFSDIDLDHWKDYDDILTDSLWLLGARDRSGPHVGDYWGNFVPQIPHQIIRRFTKPGEAVVDLFSGMGTTLIECRRLGRIGVGVELLPDVAARSRERSALAAPESVVETAVLVGDATSTETCATVRDTLAIMGRPQQAECIILHPPYHDIIAFSDDPRDLSTAPTLDNYLDRFSLVVDNALSLLAPGRFLVLVIGDKYAKGACVPLSFRCMDICTQHGLTLKAINVKDIQGNEKGKGKATNLWRYRALRHGFYVFKHEYVMVFRKGR